VQGSILTYTYTLVRTLLIHECTIEAEILSLKDYCWEYHCYWTYVQRAE